MLRSALRSKDCSLPAPELAPELAARPKGEELAARPALKPEVEEWTSSRRLTSSRCCLHLLRTTSAGSRGLKLGSEPAGSGRA
eukprot:3112111-Rhodomonas_salina.2